MNILRALLDRFRLERRPPSGPLTTDEESDAEALRNERLGKERKPRDLEHAR
jgi:hypothetical protein